MTAKEIVRQYMKDNGYTGLWREGCWGCGLDDLCPLGCLDGGCQPGYRVQGEDGEWETVEEKL